MPPTMTPEELQAALAEPFPPDQVGWKPQATSGNRALAIAYIDARNVMDRLDSVLGIANWQDDYTPLPDGNVVCTLRLRISGEWVSKTDVGGQSDQKDHGDKEKAAFSDALKRAGVKWGIGRYLYNLDGGWVDYDPQTKKLKGTPALPPSAIPKPKPGAAKPTNGKAEKPAEQAAKTPDGKPLRNGADLRDYILRRDEALVVDGFIQPGELLSLVTARGTEKKLHVDMTQWDAKVFPGVLKYVEEAEAGLRVKPQEATA